MANRKPTLYDVAIVGTGPAGSLLAHAMATAGWAVLLLEKKQLPRYKTCGGGLTQRALKLIPFDIQEVIEDQAHTTQGKPIVNSISMKEGEDRFREHATLCRRYGAAVIVMAFDEAGQADTKERKVEICARAYRILVDEIGFPPEDIIFDPNIFAVATGIEEHNN